jgi:NADPH:quinone reductase-like Zn-dependent oxidoreductase
VEAASVPVIGTTAWVMLFEHAKVAAGRRVLVLGAAGNVGAYAVQLATRASPYPPATSSSTQSGGRCWRDRSTR